MGRERLLSDDDVVKLTEVASEQEAALLCGYLEANGIEAVYAPQGSVLPFGGLQALAGAGAGAAYGGRQDVRIRRRDAQQALELLATLPDQ